MNSYELSRAWFDFSFENPDLVKPNHTALYFFAIEHCNRLGWKRKFGFPTTMVMEALGIKSYNTYIKTLNQVVDFGFIKMIERSKNQHSSNIIEVSKIDKAPDKALDKALIKHGTKQSESTEQSTEQSINSIIKQLTIEQLNNKQIDKLKIIIDKFKTNKTNKDDKDKEAMFIIFWDKYHSITNQPKTDRDPSLKYWDKLSIEEMQKAIDNIQPYYDNIKDYGKGKMPKKARTYLSDKNYNDEYSIKSSSEKVYPTYQDMLKKDWDGR